MTDSRASDQAFPGTVAVITGGGSGIGQAIAQHLAGQGARVAILDIANGDLVRDDIVGKGGMAMSIVCDVTTQSEVQRAFAEVEGAFGKADVLVNSAGVAHVGTVEQTTDADLDRLYAVNVKGTFHCLQEAVLHMKGRGGAILNVASVAATVGIPDRFAYSMTKGAVLAMTYSVARDYIGQGIRCNAISPARVHTPFVDGFLARTYPGREEEMFARLAASQPIGRMGTPAEVAQLAGYLCSGKASFITGTNYAIDGGFISLKM